MSELTYSGNAITKNLARLTGEFIRYDYSNSLIKQLGGCRLNEGKSSVYPRNRFAWVGVPFPKGLIEFKQ